MLVEIPDSMVGEIPTIIANYAIAVEKAEEKRRCISRLNGEKDLKWFERMVFWEKHHPGICRESDYPRGSIQPYRYIYGYTSHNNVIDPPVIMAGSRYVLHRRYCKSNYGSAPNGWNEQVAMRYLRMIKFTSLGYDYENRDKPSMAEHIRISRMINKKYGGTCFNNPCSFGRSNCYIKGEKYYIEADSMPMLKSLFRHIDKITDIESAVDKINSAA